MKQAPDSRSEPENRADAPCPDPHGLPVLVERSPVHSAGPLSPDRRARRAALDGAPLAVQPKPLAPPEYFRIHPDERMTRERLLNDVWSRDYPAGRRTVDTRADKLRRALRDDADRPAFIESAPDKGYRCIAPVRGEQ